MVFLTLLRAAIVVSHLVSAEVYNEPYRPQVHFSPSKGWMNDPNGLVYYEGEYHLFFQYYPNSADMGPIHWGHAISRDLIHWENLPVAFSPDKDGMAFSGSAIVDEKNATGFQTSPAIKPIIAFYTRDINVEIETQHIWFSNDKGRTFERYEGNPVIAEPTLKDFRDPKVRNHDGGFVVPLAAGQEIRFYKSKDMKKWEYTSSFGNAPEHGSHSGVWECPDLIPFEVEGKKLWVLLVSINPGGPVVGSATQYFIGDFDGKKFTNFNPPGKVMWIDWGPDNYAGVTYEKSSKPDPVFIAWASNWNYAAQTPTTQWRGQMTIPRTLKLEKVNDEYRLRSFPVEEIKTLRTEKMFEATKIADGFSVSHSEQQFHAEIELEIKGGLEIVMKNTESNEAVVIKMSPAGDIEVDRSVAGMNLSKDFTKLIRGKRISKEKKLTVDIIYDASLIEIFFDKGLTSFTVLHFPTMKYNQFKLSAPGSTVKTATLHKLKSIWK